ncbi:MAG: peptidoglycan D,D-transpeptidase FtsI family protein [Acidimicrobiales bacterium]
MPGYRPDVRGQGHTAGPSGPGGGAGRPAPGRRLAGLLMVMALLFAAVVVRLTDIQVVSTQRPTAYGQAELLHTVALPALRGTIYGRSGTVLAMSLPETTVVADDFQIPEPGAEAARMAPVLGVGEAGLQAQLSRRSGYVVVADRIDGAVAAKVRALDLPGITFQEEPKRFLPNGNLALPVVGQVNTKGQGYSGIEYQYDGVLTGHPGSAVVPLDPSGRAFPGGPQKIKPARPGHGLVLTIDSSIQYDAEQALAKEVATSHAKGGWAVVLDSRTGGILAMANLVAGPTPGSAPVPAGQALAVTDVYEPGSVAKLATFAGALSDGLISPSTVLAVPPDIVVGGATFSDAEVHGAEQLTATQVLERSSNIGTIEVAQQLGPERLYHWLRAIGWGQPTGLGFPGESPGILRPPSTWSGAAMGSMPIGQDEAVTALQIADAYNVVANGGTWVPPRLVQATVDASGTRHAVPPTHRHRVLTASVASQLTGMLEDVVGPQGTAPKAAVPGYTVAGKTGTAQIPSTTGPGYVPGAFMATFAGFAPAEHPALTIVVTLDRPTPDVYGGDVAAPVFSQIAQYALRRLHIPPASATPAGTAPTGPATTIGRSGSSGPGR